MDSVDGFGFGREYRLIVKLLVGREVALEGDANFGVD